MEIRYLNWETDVQRLQSYKTPPATVKFTKQPDWLHDIPQMEGSATFDILLGSDVLYEVCSAA